MKVENNSARQILKSISIFGGLQFFLIFINLAKVKALAILIGVSGVGHFTIYSNIVTILVQLCFLGLNFSAVRSISLSLEENNTEKLVRTYSVFKSWTVICATFGFVVTILGSYYISVLSFDKAGETRNIMLLSLAVVFTILSTGNVAFLQGIRELKSMAKSGFFSALCGIVISIPLYFYFKESGIVISIVITAFLTFLFSYFYSRRSSFKFLHLKIKEIYTEGQDMIKLGIVMMLSTFIGTLVIYLINIFIVKQGSIEDLGLYAAGNGITNQCVGLIFTAMAADYFPKLSAVSNNRKKVNEMVNTQGEILLIIVCPILLILMSFSPLVIEFLLTSKFLSISTFIALMSFAMLFKAAAFPVGYISFAKGDKRVFFLFEGILNSILILVGNTLGYYFGGINGIAWGVLTIYVIYFVSVNILVYIRYKFRLRRDFLFILGVSTLLLLSGLINFIYITNYIKYIIAFFIIVISIFYSYYQLDRKITITAFLKSRLKLFKDR